MKIKDICQQTGLTDRAVRYYIEEGLISPAYTENYLGRRSFDFSPADADRLREISVLRKFGFTVAEIREMYARPESIAENLRALRSRKENTLAEEQELLRALSRSEAEMIDSVPSLVYVLSKPVENMPAPADEDSRPSRFYRCFRTAALFLAVWLPPALCLIGPVVGLHNYCYPVFRIRRLLLTILSLWPSLLLVLLPRLHLKGDRAYTVKLLVVFFCLFSAVLSPSLSLGILSGSETTDIRNYRRLDPDCLANRDPVYQDLFPQWPHYFENVRVGDRIEAVALDAHYLYRNLPVWNYACDIYAEWPLDEEEFYAEIERAEAVFAAAEADYAERGLSSYRVVTVEKGSYTCLIMYDYYEPFEPVTGSYTYYIFAYNEAELRVRYLYCNSQEHGEIQPCYLELDWG